MVEHEYELVDGNRVKYGNGNRDAQGCVHGSWKWRAWHGDVTGHGNGHGDGHVGQRGVGHVSGHEDVQQPEHYGCYEDGS